MRIFIYYITLSLLIISCNKRSAESKAEIKSQVISQKEDQSSELPIVKEVMGDLDHDGVEERVVIYETKEKTEYGNIRELQVQKKENNKWIKWHSSTNAILKSGDGGMMGDPLDLMEIKDGILNISFFGGSSWKWSYTDKYRFQNNHFELIGYTHTYFKLCEYWETSDYNLVTGKLVVKKEYEKCENQKQFFYKSENETFNKKIDAITLNNRNQKEIIFESPKYKHRISISSGNL